MPKKIIAIIVALVIVIAVGSYFVFHNNSSPAASNTQNSTSNSSSGNQTAMATITYSNNGFSPSLTTVKSGDTVEIKNTSSTDVQMQSDPHPAHTDDTDLNVGLVGAGQSKTFVVTKTGSFGFHNHLDPSQKASIAIQ